ncbi:CLUMA_CG005904, isoform A [Clunio marinus]|uniref:CLUMA_CG005904, isoform A n=1 Tax=Clunio marinus TaxID=568069 RepID=A0A1J1HW54_9DIPT|nr:CLUMA_CG005904, isoform A [Clunio marinus]
MVVILLLVPSSTSASLTTSTFTTSLSSTPAKYNLTNSSTSTRPPLSTNYGPSSFNHQSKFKKTPDANKNYCREYVNHVTRINFSTDYPQIEGAGDEPEAVVKEEEIVTKRKTELTTTKQIETRVKRQVKFEDGKVIEDTGPIVSTATTEDTDKVESEETERKTLGEPTDVVDGPAALQFNKNALSFDSSPKHLQTTNLVMGARDDGLVREEKENRVVSRDDTTELTEVEDIKHFGDFSDAVSF